MNMLWIGPTYAGGMYYYVAFPGPDATNPSYQASKALPASMSGLPAGSSGWVTLQVGSPPWTSTLAYRVVQNGTVLQINGKASVATAIPVGTQTSLGVLPANIAAAMTLPANAIVMSNSGATGATANLEIESGGTILITPQGQPLLSVSIQQAYVLNSNPNQTVLGNFGTLAAAQAACQNDVNPPIPLGLHRQIPVS